MTDEEFMEAIKNAGKKAPRDPKLKEICISSPFCPATIMVTVDHDLTRQEEMELAERLYREFIENLKENERGGTGRPIGT